MGLASSGDSGYELAFTASQTNGKWASAAVVPGTTPGQGASLSSVSCASPGNCSAGGSYADASHFSQALVVDETGGKWGSAEEVPGTALLNTGGEASISSVSCPSAGNCSAAGTFYDASDDQQLFVLNQTGGKWGNAEEIPGLASLNHGSAVLGSCDETGDCSTGSLSCATAGNCLVGGAYTDASETDRAFVASETDGKWASAQEFPGTRGFSGAMIESLSCTSPGDCGAGGEYTDGSGHQQVFVAREAGGEWGNAEEISGSGALNQGGYAQVESVSCAAASCSAGGYYRNASSPSGQQQAFITGTTVCSAANPAECLLASNAAYGLDVGSFDPPPGMTTLRSDVQASDGYSGVALLDSAGNIIIANEGAHITLAPHPTPYENWSAVAEAEILAGKRPAALADAVNFLKQIAALPEASGKKIYVTGHDLGGVEAEAQAAADTSVSGITFGASGLPSNASQGQSGNLVNFIDRGDSYGLWASDISTLHGIAPGDSMDHYGAVMLVGPKMHALLPILAEQMYRERFDTILSGEIEETIGNFPAKFKKDLGVALLSRVPFINKYDHVIQAVEYTCLAAATYLYHPLTRYASDLGLSLNPEQPVVSEAEADDWYVKQFDPQVTPTELSQVGQTSVSATGAVNAPDIDLAPQSGSALIARETYTLSSPKSEYDVNYDPAEEVSSVKVDDSGSSYEIFNDDRNTHSWSTSVKFYSGQGETGQITGVLYNWHPGGSQLQLFINLPPGVIEQMRNYSGPDATGKLLSLKNIK